MRVQHMVYWCSEHEIGHQYAQCPAIPQGGSTPSRLRFFDFQDLHTEQHAQKGCFYVVLTFQTPQEAYAVHDAAVPKERRSRVEDETFQYLTEVHQHYKTLMDEEERELLVGNVLAEIRGREIGICSDAPCSRMMEDFLGGAQPAQLLEFLGRFCDQELLFRYAVEASACHWCMPGYGHSAAAASLIALAMVSLVL